MKQVEHDDRDGIVPQLPRDAPVFVAGHRGLVGSAIVRRLERAGFEHLLLASREELDLRDPAAVHLWFRDHRPDYVFLAAGTVGGIMANSARPAEFIYDNLMINATVVHASHAFSVRRLLNLGSSCIYPLMASQPIAEDALLTGRLEPTNEPFAVAKIAGIKLCQAYRTQYGDDFIAATASNLYGPNDNFDIITSHVIPALIRKFHDAKREGRDVVEIWGTGAPRREFLHVDDLADACLFLMERHDGIAHVNVGTGTDLSIRELAEMMREVVHPGAELVYDPSKPDGSPGKLLDVARLRDLGWAPRITLRDGIRQTYDWFCHQTSLRGVRTAPMTSTPG